MSADRIRALADSGTPGPWVVTQDQFIEQVIPGQAIVGWNAFTSGDTHAADAAKIVAAVNALPKVAALVEATRTHVEFVYQSRTMRPDLSIPYCRQCGHAWPCQTAAARDELVAALGVDSE